MILRAFGLLSEFKARRFVVVAVLLLGAGAAAAEQRPPEQAGSDKVEPKHRSHLPLPNTVRPSLVTYDAKSPDTHFPPIEQLRPPKGAPNVLIVLIDDVGFGASSTFGGPCQTPTLDRLAAGGLRYTRFHTTALCSPTRQALLTGRNHHSAGMGGITEIATGAPGYSSVRPNSMAPLAQTLTLNGYSTAQFGKCHEVPVWQTSPAGPFDAWPSRGGGFEYFYGFLGGEANQWYPTLFEGTTPVDIKKTPEEGYHLVDGHDRQGDEMDRRSKKSLAPDKPFFVYFAPGATHAPHHVPKAWADKYKGKFDQGYVKLREETFARQKKLGRDSRPTASSPHGTRRSRPGTKCRTRSSRCSPARWKCMRAFSNTRTTTSAGSSICSKSWSMLDDTLIYYICGDNGASAEGSINGCFNEMSYFNGLQALETPEYLTPAARQARRAGVLQPLRRRLGACDVHALPMDQAGRLSLGRHAQRHGRPLAERHSRTRAKSRTQFTHVIDVAPTILEAAGLPQPESVNGIQQDPIEGVEHALFVQ